MWNELWLLTSPCAAGLPALIPLSNFLTFLGTRSSSSGRALAATAAAGSGCLAGCGLRDAQGCVCGLSDCLLGAELSLRVALCSAVSSTATDGVADGPLMALMTGVGAGTVTTEGDGSATG